MRKQVLILCLALTTLSVGCSPSERDIENRVINLVNVSELGTVEYTVRKVIKIKDEQKWAVGDRKILFSATAYLKAGIDMSQIDIAPDGNSITVTMPHAKLVSFNMPADEITTEFEHYSTLRSRFSGDEQNILLQQAEEDIKAEVPNYGLLEDAERNASEFLTAMLSQMGYTDINIKFV